MSADWVVDIVGWVLCSSCNDDCELLVWMGGGKSDLVWVKSWFLCSSSNDNCELLVWLGATTRPLDVNDSKLLLVAGFLS
jgi:hypothetical protein